jgi:hypothetical protein
MQRNNNYQDNGGGRGYQDPYGDSGRGGGGGGGGGGGFGMQMQQDPMSQQMMMNPQQQQALMQSFMAPVHPNPQSTAVLKPRAWLRARPVHRPCTVRRRLARPPPRAVPRRAGHACRDGG